MLRFRDKITGWFDIHRRALPWRESDDPYRIWVSEVILQQTRVSQGLEYYHRFLEAFPSVRVLASADEDHVLKVWQGLGYYSRARNMVKAARVVQREMGGRFPVKYEDLIRLPGIGDYTASAVSSIAGNEPRPVIDGNVQRVVSRIFGITDPVNSTGMKKKIRAILEKEIDKNAPGIFNQALMEFGAIHCVPSNPGCLTCIFRDDCYAFNKGMVKELPVKKTVPAVQDRYFHYLVLLGADKETHKIVMKRRGDDDIWARLWEFPLVEAHGPHDFNDPGFTEQVRRMLEGIPFRVVSATGWYRHKLSHRNIHARFFFLKAEKLPFLAGAERVDPQKVVNYPVSRLVEQFLEAHPQWFSGGM